MEVNMRNVKWLMAMGLAVATAGCVESSGYPNASYSANRGYYNNGYSYKSTATYGRRGPNGDYDRDGIPNRYDRDANGDGVPDRYQRRRSY
jgi:hypothetical protein